MAAAEATQISNAVPRNPALLRDTLTFSYRQKGAIALIRPPDGRFVGFHPARLSLPARFLRCAGTFSRSPVLRSRLGVLLDSKLPGRAKRAGQHVLICRGQPNMGCSIPSPSAGDGQEHLRQFIDKRSLLFQR